MSSVASPVLEAVGSLHGDSLVEWLRSCLMEGSHREFGPVPHDYPDRTSYLMSAFASEERRSLARRLGGAALRLLNELTKSGSRPWPVPAWLADLLTLLGYLPTPNAQGLIRVLDELIDVSAYRAWPSRDKDCHRLVLLAVAAHGDGGNQEHYWFTRVSADLQNPDYVVAALAVLAMHAPKFAVTSLVTALALMDANGIPAQMILLRLARRVRNDPELSKAIRPYLSDHLAALVNDEPAS
jgi:hypothetical protein